MNAKALGSFDGKNSGYLIRHDRRATSRAGIR